MPQTTTHAPPKRKRGPASPPTPPAPPAARGLCTTCANAQTCTFSRDRDMKVLTCGEYEGESGTAPRPTRRPAVRAHRNPVPGLCATCMEFDGCTFPRPQSGVWHCEEFR